MSTHPTDGVAPTPEPLALRPREAAQALGLSARKLWELTNRNEIPHVHVGRAVLYPVDSLRAWLAEQAAKGVRR